MNIQTPPKRSYRQGARAAAAEATAERILEAFAARLRDAWFEEIRLEDVAQDAGVTMQTVIRRFGGKEGLLAAADLHISGQIHRHRAMPRGDMALAIDTIIADYERNGDLVIRLLAQEDRHAPLRALADGGRAGHRAWIGGVFAPWLDRMDTPRRLAAHDALVVALDLYVWKLIRRDMGRPVAALRALMTRLCLAALDGADPIPPPNPEERRDAGD